MVFGVGIVVVVYVVPAVEKKTQSKSGKNTQKDEKKKREKKSAEKSNASGLSLTCNHAEARKKCFAVLIRTRRFSLSCFSFLFSSLFLLSLSLRSRFFFSLGRRSLLKKLLLYKIHLSLSHPSIFPSHFLFFYASRALTLLLTTTRYN